MTRYPRVDDSGAKLSLHIRILTLRRIHVKVENLTKVYPNGTQALKNVSFEVKDGEFLAVIGLSGSGKSTLLRCINRLIEPTSGKIYWDDQDVTAASGAEMRKIRRQIGMVFQQFNLVKRSSVFTNVLSGRLGYVNTFSSSLHLFSAAGSPAGDRQPGAGRAGRQGSRARRFALRRAAAARGHRPRPDAGAQADPGR